MSVSLTMSGCGHNHYTRLCVCLSSLSIRRSFTGPEVQMLQCHHDNSHVETLDFHSWLDALFSLGFNDDIIPQHAEERSDLYCLWKPLQHNCGPFFFLFFFHSFSNLLASPGKWGKSLIFLLSSKNNTSWQVIGSVKCDSLKRGEPPPHPPPTPEWRRY